MSGADGAGRVSPWPEVLAFARHAEAIGLDSVWVCDHLVSNPPDRPTEGIHEGWTILSALAASTTTLELGQLVMCASFRNPALLAKMAVSADAVSGGRLTLGVGAGWDTAEHEAFGYPADHLVGRFEEAIAIIRELLRGERVTFAGRYHRVSEAMLLPRPDREIPILVAGNGPRMLRATARHAAAWNTAWYRLPDEHLRSRLADLDAVLASEGRDPATLRRTVGVEVDARNAGDLAATLDACERLGFDDVIVQLVPPTARLLERVAEARC
jgi:probable F420-dependent oxidoreductase